MSSTYSPDLRLELIGTGDQAGVWGNTTNTNLGTLIENAVAGYTSVSIIASPQALTANDGAEDEARFAMIALTTTTGANFTVCIPPNSKAYTLYNASSYTATISNSTTKNGITLSGGTTVAIPAGKTMSVWSDGTNVAAQNNHLPNLTLASALPVASGGTGVTTAAAITSLVGNLLFPVGSIYTNVSVATNPATLLGFGTWTAFGSSRVLVGAGDGYTAGSTGGSADAVVVSHTHTASSGLQSANHTHSFSGSTSSASLTGSLNGAFLTGSGVFADNGARNYPRAAVDNNRPDVYGVNMDASHSHSFSGTTGGVSADHNHAITVNSAGVSGTGANMQPYVVVYMWQRTA